ncbi:hypothetical protein J5N97_022649 [Dioscorea zingiberensis]|uniref:Glyoxal oxidase N-terminal domain-containing protein n=1 Tax=Dioscorea zingiberensis TaxID=325984 RepID=A0A9D5CAW1_9LILI|nr:hypothetical protein J5N97_022649 [Dioscorea zingiberensis]
MATTTVSPSLLLFLLLLLVLSTFSVIIVTQLLPGIGREWRLLKSSMGISTMHMQLLPGDKLLAFDCTDFGPSNISLPGNHCRLDRSDLALTTNCTSHSVLLELPTLFLRPLTILIDTWCSSDTLLPNASFFKFGGFNDGDHTIRLFASITPTSNWTETSGYLSSRRWYATNQLLPNGRKPNHDCCWYATNQLLPAWFLREQMERDNLVHSRLAELLEAAHSSSLKKKKTGESSRKKEKSFAEASYRQRSRAEPKKKGQESVPHCEVNLPSAGEASKSEDNMNLAKS